MATLELNDANFNDTLENNEMVIIDFWAGWCGPCKMFGPIYEEVSEKYPDVVFGKVNTEVEQKLAAYFQIRSIPTIAFIREKFVIDMAPGVLSAEALSGAIDQLKALDMEEFRKKVEEEEKKQQQKQ